jgi:DNA-binding CsgD family transcriptional regulator
MVAAAAHVSGLIEQDPVALEFAALTYSASLGRAWATEDAGVAWAEQGDRAAAVTRLHEAHALYEQLDAPDSTARVRARLRATGIRVRHWGRSDRPAFGWESLTDTERRITGFVAQGLSNRQVASQMFLSVHTIAFHLRGIFCKLDVHSRVQLARLVVEQTRRSPMAAVMVAATQLLDQWLVQPIWVAYCANGRRYRRAESGLLSSRSNAHRPRM